MFASSAAASLAPTSTGTPTGTSSNTLASPVERDGSVIGISDTGEEQAFNDFAKRVWNYVNATAELVGDMDSEVCFAFMGLRGS